MKKTLYPILITALLLNASLTKAQNYASIFGSTSTTWSVILHGYCDFIVDSTLTASSDTTVDSMDYKIIDELYGFLREDTVAGKVWIYDLADQKEYLVMDLSLGLGSTFYIIDDLGDSIPMITDSVYFEAGLKHIRFSEMLSLCGLTEKIEFVEGSGPNTGFRYMGSSYNGEVISYMLCHFKDGNTIIGNDLFDDTCQVFEVGIRENEHSGSDFRITPNPTTGSISIQTLCPGVQVITAELFNSIGNKLSIRFSGGSANLSGLDVGLYFLIITDETGKRSTFKVIKN